MTLVSCCSLRKQFFTLSAKGPEREDEKLKNLEATNGPFLSPRCGMLVDLCRGPHLRHTGQIGGLKLLTVSRQDRVRPRLLILLE